MTLRRTMTLRRLTAIGIALALPFAVTACSESGENSDDSASGMNTETEAVTSAPATSATDDADETAYELVSPDPFMDDLGDNANLTMTVAGTAYFCTLGAAAVACTANPDETVPNLEDMPNNPWAPFTGRPGAIFASDDGIAWGVLEGGTPGSAELQPGQRLEYLNGWCQAPDGDSIECGYNDESFTVAGPDKTVMP